MLNRFVSTWSTWVMVILVLATVNLVLAGVLSWMFDLSQAEIATLFFFFMVAWLATGWYRTQRYAREYREMLAKFQGKIEKGEE